MLQEWVWRSPLHRWLVRSKAHFHEAADGFGSANILAAFFDVIVEGFEHFGGHSDHYGLAFYPGPAWTFFSIIY